MSYTLIEKDGTVIRDSDQLVVSPANNVNYQDHIKYQLWVEAGNQVNIKKDVPLTIELAQAKKILKKKNLLDAINTAITSLEGEDMELIKIDWEYRAHIRRDHPAVKMIASLTHMSEAEIDQLFIEALDI